MSRKKKEKRKKKRLRLFEVIKILFLSSSTSTTVRREEKKTNSRIKILGTPEKSCLSLHLCVRSRVIQGTRAFSPWRGC